MIRKVRCWGCGRELSGEEEKVGLCRVCEEEAYDEAVEMLAEDEQEREREDGMMYQ